MHIGGDLLAAAGRVLPATTHVVDFSSQNLFAQRGLVLMPRQTALQLPLRCKQQRFPLALIALLLQWLVVHCRHRWKK